jgi:hypothetical protein
MGAGGAEGNRKDPRKPECTPPVPTVSVSDRVIAGEVRRACPRARKRPEEGRRRSGGE